MVGQAVYTWSSRAGAGVSGDDFVALSPCLTGKLPWLKNLPAPIIQFAAGRVLTPEERREYKPLGRHTDGSEAVLFRKVDAGKDIHERPGRYIVHLIVGQREYLPLSSLYTIYQRNWLSAVDVPLNHHIELHDLPVSDPSHYEIVGLTRVGEEKVLQSVRQLVAAGTTDVTGFSDDEMLSIMACLPAWVDTNAVLASTWGEFGPKATLTVPDGAPPVKGPDYRAQVHIQEIQAIRAQYSNLLKVGGTSRSANETNKPTRGSRRRKSRDIRTTHKEEAVATIPPTRALADAASETPAIDELRAAVEKWQLRGTRKLSVREKQIIENAPADTLSIVSQSGGRLPDRLSRGQLDALAIRVLRECGDTMHWPMVVRSIPESIEIAQRYVNSVPEPSVLLAGFSINLSEARRFEIVLNESLPKDAIANILKTTRESKELTDGLCESLRVSCYQHNRLLGALLLGDESDQDWLFDEILPRALDLADLVPIAAGQAEHLVRWLGIANQGYARGLTEILQWYAIHYSRHQRRIWESDLPRTTWRRH